MSKLKGELTHREALLLELMHVLSHGSASRMGLSLSESFDFIVKRLKHQQDKNIVELIEERGHALIQEVKQALEE